MFSFSLGKYIGAELSGPILSVCFASQETAKLFSEVTVHLALPPTMEQCPGPVGHPVVSHCAATCLSLITSDIDLLCRGSFTIHISLSDKRSFRSFAIFIWVLFLTESEFLLYSGYRLFIK